MSKTGSHFHESDSAKFPMSQTVRPFHESDRERFPMSQTVRPFHESDRERFPMSQIGKHFHESGGGRREAPMSLTVDLQESVEWVGGVSFNETVPWA